MVEKATRGTLTHVVHWEAKLGWQHIDVEEAEKIYDGKTVRSSEQVLMCSLCHDYVTLTRSSAKRPAYFKHKRMEQESVKDCPDRSENKGGISHSKVSLKDAKLPLRLEEHGSKYSLKLGILPEYSNISLSDERLIITTDKSSIKQKISLESLDYDKVTYFELRDVAAKEYYLKFESEDINDYGLPHSALGVIDGAFFDEQTKRRIPFNGQVQLGKEYYFVISKSSSKYQDWKRLRSAKHTTTKELGNLNRNILVFSIKANKLNFEVASFFFILGVNLVNKLDKVYPIWPETIRSQDRYFPNSNELILYNPKKYGIALQASRSANADIDENVFVPEPLISNDRRRALITSKNSYITDYVFLWQDDTKLTKRKSVKNEVTVYDSDRNSDKYQFEIYTYNELPKKKLVIESKKQEILTVILYEASIPVDIREGSKVRLRDDEINPGQEIRIYDGLVLLKRLKFADNDSDLDNKLYKQLLSVQNSEKIKFKSNMAIWGIKLADYPKCRRWLQECKIKREIPRVAVKILQKEFRR